MFNSKQGFFQSSIVADVWWFYAMSFTPSELSKKLQFPLTTPVLNFFICFSELDYETSPLSVTEFPVFFFIFQISQSDFLDALSILLRLEPWFIHASRHSPLVPTWAGSGVHWTFHSNVHVVKLIWNHRYI